MKRLIIIFFLGVAIFSLSAQNDKYGEKVELDIQIPEGARPWTSLDLNNNPEQFQFAIVTDRTGGMRPGIFKEGTKRLNLLQPEFVMSVGDLIQGYTRDLDELNRQWDEFDEMVQNLEMPFFYVPGNHDITNEVMDSLWRERLGPTNYYFKYKDVLFMALNSEDQYRGASRGTISDEQYEWIKKTLEENKEVKWTLLFMHQPLWLQEAETLRWPDVEELLKNRDHTVFVGHRHHYVKYERNNGKYFMLATTGGGSSLRGPEFGEFDHVVWVTMTEAGPLIANVRLEGVYDENVMDEPTWDFISEMGRRNPVEIEPLYAEEKFEEGTVKIKITNDMEVPMEVTLNDDFSFSYKTDFNTNKVEVAPNSVEFVEMEVAMRNKRKAENASSIRLHAHVKYNSDEAADVEFPFSYNIAPQPKLMLPKTKKSIKVDADLKEWKDLPFSLVTDSDASVLGSFGIAQDDEFIYIAGQIIDDEVYLDTQAVLYRQDYVGIALNADPMVKSATNDGAGWYRNSFYIQGTPENDNLASQRTPDEELPEGTQWKCKVNEKGYAVEVAIPIAYVKELQGEKWKTVRVNFIVQDRDKGMTRFPRYYWMPNWRGSSNVLGSGMFFRK